MRTRRAAPALAVLLTTTALALVPQASATDANAGPGDGYPGFAAIGGEPGSTDEHITAVAVQGTGKVLVAQRAAGTTVLRRLLPDGTPDAGFGEGGQVESGEEWVEQIMVLPDDRIVIAEEALRQFTAQGTPDASFSLDGVAEIDEAPGYAGTYATSLLREPDGDLVVVGETHYTDGADWDVFAQRWRASGAVDPYFRSHHRTYFGQDVQSDNLVSGVLPGPSDSYYVVGRSASPGEATQPVVWHLRADSNHDVEIPHVLSDLPPSAGWTWIPGQTPTSAYLVGQGEAGPYLAKLVVAPAGVQVDPTWGTTFRPTISLPAWARAGAVQPDGKVLLATYAGLVRILPDGSLDGTWSSAPSVPTPQEDVLSLALTRDGGVLTAGLVSGVGTGIGPRLDKYVGRLADSSTSIAHAPAPGLTQTSVVTYRSAGPDVVGDAKLTIETPPGASSRLTPSQGSCAGNGTSFTCSLGAVTAGGEVTVQVTTTSTSALTGALTATGSSELFDPDTVDQRSTATISATTPPTASPSPPSSPTLTVVKRPVAQGTPRVGAKLRATTGTWSTTPSSYKYRWLRNGKAIKKATARTYRLTARDRGKKIAVRVTALKAGHASGVATSRAVRVRGGTARTAAKVAAGPPVRGRLIASPPEVGPGQAILLTGIAGGHIPRRVVLQLRTPDGWTSLQRKPTREGGLFRFTHRAPDVTGVLAFRVRVPAAPHIGGDLTVTPTRRVRVTT